MRRTLLVLLASLVLPLAGLVSKAEAATGPIVIGVSFPVLMYSPFFDEMNSVAGKAARELGVKLVVMNAQWNDSQQAAGLGSLVQQGVQGILVAPKDADRLVPAIEAAVKAGIPVATIDTPANTTQVLFHLGADNLEGARAAARFIIEKLGNKGSVIELEGPVTTHANAKARKEGFEEEINKSNVQLLASKSAGADWDRALAGTIVRDLIAKYPKLDAVYAANDGLALGAVDGMTVSNVDPSKKIIVCFDVNPTTAIYLKQGDITAAIDQLPGEQVTQAIQILVDYIKNKTQPPQKIILLKPKLVTKATLPAG